MGNATKIMSLVSAVLITATVHGSLLWGLNDAATEGASRVAPTVATRLSATSTESRPEMRYVTLEPVVVVGRLNDAFTADHPGALVSALVPGTQVGALTLQITPPP